MYVLMSKHLEDVLDLIPFYLKPVKPEVSNLFTNLQSACELPLIYNAI